MHILFVTHYYEPDSGAAANRITRLAKLLHERGHQITVLAPMPHYPQGIKPEGYRHRWTVIENWDGVRVIHIWLWTTSNPAILRRMISQLSFMLTCSLRGLFVKRPDVLFIENQPIFTGLAGWFISKVKRTGYVLNVSDYWPEYLVVAGVVSETSLIYRVFKALTNLTQKQASVIVAMVDALMAKIEDRIGPVKRKYVIHNAVDLERLSPANDDQAFRAKFKLGAARLVTFLGGLGPHIDLETMLEAARPFAGQENLTFLFVGTGTQKEALVSRLSEPEFAHCRWIEWIGADDLPGFWAASYLTYWALHHNELDRMRFQAKLYEALATGTPPIIAVDGLMSDLLAETQTGITVMPGDSQALADAIRRMLDDSESHAAMAQRGRAYAEAHFDPDKQADAYEAALRDARR
jgi:glycosyltransferase involved in cell wall biosynthesis